MAMTVTQIATATAALAWMFVEWALRGKPTVVGICSGAVAGLVAITPASGFVGPAGALAPGSPLGRAWGATARYVRLRRRSTASASTASAASSARSTGVFAIEQYGGNLARRQPGPGAQPDLWRRIVIVYDASVSLIILKLIDVTIGLRLRRHRARGSRHRAAREAVQ
jgi:Amt family ammonium transporter